MFWPLDGTPSRGALLPWALVRLQSGFTAREPDRFIGISALRGLDSHRRHFSPRCSAVPREQVPARGSLCSPGKRMRDSPGTELYSKLTLEHRDT